MDQRKKEKGEYIAFIGIGLLLSLLIAIIAHIKISDNAETTIPSNDSTYISDIKDSSDLEYQKEPESQYNYIGEYQIIDADTSDYHRLFINEDHTARIKAKSYEVRTYYDNEEYYPGNLNQYERPWSGKNRKEGERFIKENVDELDYEGHPWKKVELKEKEYTQAFSWQKFENENIGTYIKLRPSSSGLFDDDEYVWNGRIYYSYEAMLAQDENRSMKIIKIK